MAQHFDGPAFAGTAEEAMAAFYQSAEWARIAEADRARRAAAAQDLAGRMPLVSVEQQTLQLA
jgi:hypothetical protein